MRLTWRDGLATLLVAAAAVLYALWAANALMPGVSTRWMTVIAFALGFATAALWSALRVAQLRRQIPQLRREPKTRPEKEEPPGAP